LGTVFTIYRTNDQKLEGRVSSTAGAGSSSPAGEARKNLVA